jgi:protein TIF31
METPDSFKQETGTEASPTVSASNCDIRNLNRLHKLDIPTLHVLNTVLIDYKGHRIIA